MPNVVFDASTIVGAAINVESIPVRAIALARQQARICLSQEVEAEIREVLARPKFRFLFDQATQQLLLDALTTGALLADPVVRVTDCRDAKDNKYLELALAAGAETIVSSDGDLLALDPWRGVRIVSPVEYVRSRVASEGGKP
jgi:putative PIN family toxin of toxin-antitoxin system